MSLLNLNLTCFFTLAIFVILLQANCHKLTTVVTSNLIITKNKDQIINETKETTEIPSESTTIDNLKESLENNEDMSTTISSRKKRSNMNRISTTTLTSNSSGKKIKKRDNNLNKKVSTIVGKRGFDTNKTRIKKRHIATNKTTPIQLLPKKRDVLANKINVKRYANATLNTTSVHKTKRNDKKMAQNNETNNQNLPIPKFFTLLSPEQQQKFLALKNDSLTRAQIEANVHKWIEEQPETIKSEFNKFKSNMTKLKMEIKQNILSKLRFEESKVLFNKIEDIMDNKDVTYSQMCTELEKAIQSAPDTALDELHFRDKILDNKNHFKLSVCKKTSINELNNMMNPK